MEFRDPFQQHQETLTTVRGRLVRHLGEKVPYHERSNARLTEEWQGLRENAFSLGDCRIIRDYMSLISFELCTGQVLSCQTHLLQLLVRMSKRHLNMVKVLPAPASSSAQNAEHLLTCSWLLGAHDQRFGTEWSSVLNETMPLFAPLLAATSLRLHDLDAPLFGGNRALFAALCQKLNDDLVLSLQAATLLVADYSSQFKRIENDPDWITLDHAAAEERMSASGGRLLEDFNRILEAELQNTLRGRALIRHQFSDFLDDLARAAALLDAVLNRLDRYDRDWFSRQFGHQALHVENHVLICTLAHELRMAGEDLDHIEAFARALKTYAREHRAPCAGMLDDEITSLAPSIAESSVLRALQRARVSDPDCPLSIRHRNHISEVIKKSEAVLSRIADQASAPPASAESSLSSASVPGVGSVNLSP